jgi:hypothetical protein
MVDYKGLIDAQSGLGLELGIGGKSLWLLIPFFADIP